MGLPPLLMAAIEDGDFMLISPRQQSIRTFYKRLIINSCAVVNTVGWFHASGIKTRVANKEDGSLLIVISLLPFRSRNPGNTRAYCACSRCGWRLFGNFYSPLSFSPLSPSLWETARYRLKYCLKVPLNPKQPTNQTY